MKEVGNVTRVAPDRRVDSLMRFRRRLQDNAEVTTRSTMLSIFITIFLLDPKGTRQLGTEVF